MKHQLAILTLVLAMVLAIPSMAQEEEASGAIDPKRSLKIQIQHHLDNLKQEDYNVLESSISKLALFGDDAIMGLRQVAMDGNQTKSYRLNALYALGRMERLAFDSAPLIVRLINHDDDDFKATTAGALGRIKNPAPKILEALEKLLSYENEWVSNSAKAALERINTAKCRAILRAHAAKKEAS